MAQEVQHRLIKINRQIDLNISEITKSQQNVLLLLEHDLYYLLANLGILKIPRALFDQQILLFKRLVNNLLIEHETNAMLPLVKALQNPKTAEKVSKCFGIYLVEYTNYDEVNIFHLNFIVSFIPKILKVYKRFPRLLEIWLQYLCQDVITIETLTGQIALPLEHGLDNRKYFPLYDLLYSLLFTEDCKDQIIETYFLELIVILNNSEFPFLFQWLRQFSDISRCFINRFAYIFNEACIGQDERNILEYQRFLMAFNKVLVSLSLEFREQCLLDFELQFFSKLLQHTEADNSNIVYIFLIKTIDAMLPFISNSIFKDFITELFQSKIFSQRLDDCFSQPKYSECKILFLALFNKILETNCSHLVKDLFCFKDRIKEKKKSSCKPNKNLLMKAMQIFKLKYNEGERQNSFLSILQKFQAKSPQDEYLVYDDEKLIPRLISESLLTFFQNKYECNKLLIALVINLLSFERGIIYNVYSKDVRSKYSDIENIMEFLFDAFLNYNDMINEHNERKYLTMDSAMISQNDQHEYLRPTPKFLERLSPLECNIGTSDVNHGSLILNMNCFQDFLNDIFYCIKIRHIIT